jgi:hypothetical protein
LAHRAPRAYTSPVNQQTTRLPTEEFLDIGASKPWAAPDVPGGVVSVSDPDTQRMKANRGYVQGYNAQAVVDEGQIVLAAEDHQHPRGLPQPRPDADGGDQRA